MLASAIAKMRFFRSANATVRIPFSQKSKRRCCCFGHDAVPRRTRARAPQRRSERVAFASLLFASTSSRGFPRRDEHALTLPDAPEDVLRERMGCPQSRLADDRPLSKRDVDVRRAAPSLADAPDAGVRTPTERERETMTVRDFEADRARLAKARKKRLAVAVEALASDAAVTVVPKDEAAVRLIMRAVRDTLQNSALFLQEKNNNSRTARASIPARRAGTTRYRTWRNLFSAIAVLRTDDHDAR